MTLRAPAIVLLALAALASGCDQMQPSRQVDFAFDFAAGPQGWTAGFADYPAGQEAFYDLESDYRTLPAPLGPGSALFLSGDNHSDDLFMYYARRVEGLEPDTVYDATFEVTIATDVPAGCGGVGGSPGESVYLKAGAAGQAPAALPDDLGILRLNIDHGNQANPGANAVVMGTIQNSTPCEAGTRPWELKSFTHPGAALPVRTDGQGALWLIMGTDSAFEASTSLFYSRFAAMLRPRPEGPPAFPQSSLSTRARSTRAAASAGRRLTSVASVAIVAATPPVTHGSSGSTS